MPEFRLILTMTQDQHWQGERRKIDAQFLNDYVGDHLDEYTFMVAGPPQMVESMKIELGAAGVKDEHVLAQRFSGY